MRGFPLRIRSSCSHDSGFQLPACGGLAIDPVRHRCGAGAPFSSTLGVVQLGDMEWVELLCVLALFGAPAQGDAGGATVEFELAD